MEQSGSGLVLGPCRYFRNDLREFSTLSADFQLPVSALGDERTQYPHRRPPEFAGRSRLDVQSFRPTSLTFAFNLIFIHHTSPPTKLALLCRTINSGAGRRHDLRPARVFPRESDASRASMFLQLSIGIERIDYRLRKFSASLRSPRWFWIAYGFSYPARLL